MSEFDVGAAVNRAFEKVIPKALWQRPDPDETLEKVMRGLGLQLDGDMIFEGHDKRLVAIVNRVEWLEDDLQVSLRLRVRPELSRQELIVQ